MTVSVGALLVAALAMAGASLVMHTRSGREGCVKPIWPLVVTIFLAVIAIGGTAVFLVSAMSVLRTRM